MIEIKEQENLFIQIGKRLKRKITAYAIGGTAMMFHGFKENTLDIDLVFTEIKDREEFKDAAKYLGYKEMDSVKIYGKKDNSPEMVYLGENRLDLFVLDVIDFKFSNNMEKRAKDVHEFSSNFVLKIADVHDIIIMKCATRRLKDEDDIVNLVKSNKIDWKILIDEAKNQLKLGRELAIVDLGYLLEKLKFRYKINVPLKIIDELWRLAKRQARKID